MYVALAVILGLGLIACVWFLIARRGKRGGRHFDMGVSEPMDVPEGEDVWGQQWTSTSGLPTADRTLNARPEERTSEMIKRETTGFAGDLLDPRSPGHAEWEQRGQARIHEAGVSPTPPESGPDQVSSS
jgi:hypothetical protein